MSSCAHERHPLASGRRGDSARICGPVRLIYPPQRAGFALAALIGQNWASTAAASREIGVSSSLLGRMMRGYATAPGYCRLVADALQLPWAPLFLATNAPAMARSPRTPKGSLSGHPARYFRQALVELPAEDAVEAAEILAMVEGTNPQWPFAWHSPSGLPRAIAAGRWERPLTLADDQGWLMPFHRLLDRWLDSA